MGKDERVMVAGVRQVAVDQPRHAREAEQDNAGQEHSLFYCCRNIENMTITHLPSTFPFTAEGIHSLSLK